LAKVPIQIIFALGAGVIALGYYISWWFVLDRYASPWLEILLVITMAFVGAQVIGSWLLYWLASFRLLVPKQPLALRVDVFLTACGEPLTMIEQTVRAALSMEGEHRTYLLDDANDLACAHLCERLGAQYLTRDDRAGAKAGNINSALPRTDGDIIVIYDIDHVPQPDFLTRTLHHFADPRVGFVQVMLTFSNQNESWMARAAAETSLDYYNPTSIGMDVLHSATLMGSNALIRRTALESIGGYKPGLAEDLATSLALHAAGWRSTYVAEPLAPGLAPATLLAWYAQQLKWARGVFEVLLTALPRAFIQLDWGQRLCYIVRTTKYWIGPAVLLHLVISGGAVLFAAAPTQALVQEYLLHLAPLLIIDLWIRREALRLWRHPSVPAIVPLRALALVYFSWPVYSLAWIMAVLRIPLRFWPTPKSPASRLNPIYLLPQAVASLALLVGLVLALAVQRGFTFYTLLVVVAAQMGLQGWLIGSWVSWQLARPRRLESSEVPAWTQAIDA
jgi:cellulose synthase (UDP-forming)